MAIRFLRRTARWLALAFDGHGPTVTTTALLADDIPARLYAPPGSQNAPILLFFHGGGFLSCGLDTHHALCCRLAHASGLRVLAIGYRLAPEHPAPAQVDDAIRACRWALDAPASLGGGTEALIVAGDSAGAYLALRCAIALNDGQRRIVGQLLCYPLLHLDVENWANPPWSPARWIGAIGAKCIRRQIGDAVYPSIMAYDLRNLPPTVILSGRMLDPVHPDLQPFETVLRTAGVTVEHICFPRLFHGALNMTGISRSARSVIDRAGLAARKWGRTD